MNRWLVSAALLGFAVAPAVAADLPVKAPPPAVAPVWNWTGFYVGAHGGGAWSRVDIAHSAVAAPPGFAFAADAAAVTAASSPQLKPNGFMAGLHAGYNFQSGNFVWGLEGDFSYFRLRASTAGVFPFPSTLPGGVLGPPTLTFTAATDISTDWLVTLRPRLGVVASNALFYVTGGLAVTNEKVNQLSGVLNGANFSSSISDTRLGWTVGGGIEYMLTRNWTIRAEYLHLDFGTASGAGTGNIPAGVLGNLPCTATQAVITGPGTYTGCSISSRLTAEVIKAGITYKFGVPDTVVARY